MMSFKQSLKTVDAISINFCRHRKKSKTPLLFTTWKWRTRRKLENRAIIKFCCNLEMTPTKTFEKKMQQAKKENKISLSLVFKWHEKFSDWRKNAKDDQNNQRTHDWRRHSLQVNGQLRGRSSSPLPIYWTLHNVFCVSWMSLGFLLFTSVDFIVIKDVWRPGDITLRSSNSCWLCNIIVQLILYFNVDVKNILEWAAVADMCLCKIEYCCNINSY